MEFDLDSRFSQHVVDKKNAKAMNLLRKRCRKLAALIDKIVPAAPAVSSVLLTT